MSTSTSTPIEDYAVLGDLSTAALVSRGGSVDWLCLPRFDSHACFAAILGTRDHGRWLIGPVGEATTTRRYVDDSFVLETVHQTATGSVRVTDLMPLGDGRADIVRRIEGVDGTVRMRHEWVVRFGYGKTRPWVTRSCPESLASEPDDPLRPTQSKRSGSAEDEVIRAVAGPDMLVLRGPRLPHPDDGHHVDEFDVVEGDCLVFSTTWFRSHLPIPKAFEMEPQLTETVTHTSEWAARSCYAGPYAEHVTRSLLVLRVLSHGRTGGIVAAPTTSLPEDFGGERNWDYRFCWLRDASLALESLLGCGYLEETRLWRNWLLRAVAGDPEDMQIMYRVDGGRELPERELDHLPGYAGSRPVRAGNGAVGQRQTDVLGEVMIALHEARKRGVVEAEDTWSLQRALIDNLAEHWQQPDNGLWEIRGPLRHFTHSRVMVWAAFDRAVRAVEEFGLDGPVERWRELRAQVRQEVLTHGWNEERQTFVQHYETTEVDASLLAIPAVGFLPGDDPRVLGTIRAVERNLMHEGLVMRYRTGSGVDGLAGEEHPFLACSFWLVTAYAKAGRTDDATELMDRLVGLCNDVGLLSEEYDPVAHRMVGNFPQAFSHLTLVGAALALDEAVAASEKG
ncbi:glucoamylase [Humibacillus sp. DSM 29435]|uniref:glycoside hydrolase family 15 protein n=1 Tax=Humibacillus sp. DSM 29435 TaxID=1869167 RepID=UPI000871E51E|nr:glycoside hydrolase family 15 protein [Humibacillus sp. DSM 29435]OFE17645.1 glucoamylase [Humibacillus sp. DSM 29435]